jgi:hypothetical protein
VKTIPVPARTTAKPSLTEESHLIVGGKPVAVRLSPFGWNVVAAFADPIGVISAALAIWSMSR